MPPRSFRFIVDAAVENGSSSPRRLLRRPNRDHVLSANSAARHASKPRRPTAALSGPSHLPAGLRFRVSVSKFEAAMTRQNSPVSRKPLQNTRQHRLMTQTTGAPWHLPPQPWQILEQQIPLMGRQRVSSVSHSDARYSLLHLSCVFSNCLPDMLEGLQSFCTTCISEEGPCCW